MKRSEMTQVTTYNKGTLYGHNLDNILERHYGPTAYALGLSKEFTDVVVRGFLDDRILHIENLRRRVDH